MITIDKILGGPLLHSHKVSDITDIDTTYFKLDASNGPITGDTLIQPSTNSTTTFQVNQADGTGVLSVDTTNGIVYVKQTFKNTNIDLRDMGYEKESDLRGYGADYIVDKTLHNVHLRGNTQTNLGGLRIDTTQDPDTFEIYLRDAWQTILYDLTTEDGDFRHTPLENEIYVWRGDSVQVGLNNQPVVQEYKVSMGAYPAYRTLNGGDF